MLEKKEAECNLKEQQQNERLTNLEKQHREQVDKHINYDKIYFIPNTAILEKVIRDNKSKMRRVHGNLKRQIS